MRKDEWDDWFDDNRPRRPPRRPAGIITLTAATLGLMALVLGAIHLRAPVENWLSPPAPMTLTASADDRESGHFAHCQGPRRITCVIDGDTIWYKGLKIRVADINAPELSEPQCDYELDLAEKATERLTQLLNEGPFSLEPIPGRDTDKYGRALRTLRRGGHSLGEVLVAEGLAERWVGHRRDWCR